MDATGSEELWKVCDSKGNYKVLKIGEKEVNYKNDALPAGKYIFKAETDSRGGGPRKIHTKFSCKKGDKILSDVNWKLDHNTPVIYHELVVNESEAPAVLEINVRSGAILGTMDIYATFTRFPLGLLTEAEELEAELAEIEKAVNKEELISQLKRDSEFKQKAKEAGLIRPFLLLVAMHPLARYQAARPLEVKLLKKYNHDPHAEAWAVLTESGKGLKSRTEYAFEGSVKSCDWYTMVWRAESEGLKTSLPAPIKVDNKVQLCSDPNNPTVAALETDMIIKLAEKQHKNSKEDDELVKVVEKVMSEPGVKEFLATLKLKPEEEKIVGRFLIEICVQEIFADDEEEDEEEDKKDKKDKKEKHHKVHFDEVAEKIQNRLYVGFDPHTKREKNLKHAAHVAAHVGSHIAVHAILHLCPPVGLAVLGVSIARTVAGPSHDKTFETITQMLLQRLLLSTQGIYLENFY
eukprot:TRINITY_DN4171_c0_g1_i2.p1 TRINITY_DN4171_c0_g1~~TRINITY_DN4171_c0_g1_i2.p1  ORF type:complete len:480 (-),score=196.36 TRINITY_DN4171_c0_g1_i2:129-1517(-)